MAFTKEIICKLVTPKSESDSNYADYEFLLVWFGRNGAFYNKLFTDWENMVQSDSEILNITDSDTLENIPNEFSRGYMLKIDNISLNDLRVYIGLLTAKKIMRFYKDGTYEFLGLDRKSLKYTEKNGKYNFSVSLIRYDKEKPQ